ncbi:MAG: RidA family protein [Pseudacidovorax sp.]|nr:RidA family protein [Pseudacidovorax sp.]
MTDRTPEQRLEQAGFKLPAAPQPRGNYAPYCIQPMPGGARHLSLSGQTCRVEGVAIAGICMPGEPLEPARHAARIAALNLLAVIASACDGSLPSRLDIFRIRGYVRSSGDFAAHTAVLDAASELLNIAWPDARRPARTAVGVPSLPDEAYIEIELDAFLP